MKCRDPILCFTDGREKIMRNFSMAGPALKLHHHHVWDCGKCIFCRKNKSTELAMRCVLHASLYKQNCFITLTYDETHPDYHNNFHYPDIQKFKKRLRRYCKYYFGKTIQIFNVHEYGKNGKKHWHLVVFNHDFSFDVHKKKKVERILSPAKKYYNSEKLKALWPFGHHSIGDVTEASAMYQAQYTQKDFQYGHVNSTKKSHSQHSGIGKEYFLRHYDQILRLGYVPVAGRKIPTPRYFEKLAYKHYSHFYAPENFEDLPNRKRLFTPFETLTDANEHMADLYSLYRTIKDKKIEHLKSEWETQIEDYVYNNEKPDFMIASENYLYDLRNKKINNNEF